ncbi:hypothetical protein ACA910_010542 [Epithemia clementina (nom. ined.)]
MTARCLQLWHIVLALLICSVSCFTRQAKNIVKWSEPQGPRFSPLRRRLLPSQHVWLSASATKAASSKGNTQAESLPPIQIFNSKTRQKDVLIPVKEGKISMYTCGPTVYDYAHVGNFRAFLTYDLLKRVLEYYGYDVTHVCNLTDVDDKIIQRAKEQGLDDVTKLTRKYEDLFFADLKALNIRPATHYPRATEHIPEMMEMILLLQEKGLAYETSDGSWYFRTQAQPTYGTQLVQLSFDDMESTERMENSEQEAIITMEEKEHFADFCLWKAFKEGIDREDMAWSSNEFKKGRPGWHLECSAMARKFFGPDQTIDLHGGGVDLKFPHHENEIAQSEGVMNHHSNCCSGENHQRTAFCNYWFHNGFVNIGEEKMSKSLGNFLTLQTACPTALDVRAYRYLVITSQYRSPLAFAPQAIQACKSSIQRIDKVRARLEEVLSFPTVAGDGDSFGDNTAAESDIANVHVPAALSNFDAALRDDLSMPRAAAALFSIIKLAEAEFKKLSINNVSGGLSGSSTHQEADAVTVLDIQGLKAIQQALVQMDEIFGIFYQVPKSHQGDNADEENGHDDDSTNIPEEVLQLVAQRTAAKEAKDWKHADTLRNQIAELGFLVKDVKGGEPILSRR